MRLAATRSSMSWGAAGPAEVGGAWAAARTALRAPPRTTPHPIANSRRVSRSSAPRPSRMATPPRWSWRPSYSGPRPAGKKPGHDGILAAGRRASGLEGRGPARNPAQEATVDTVMTVTGPVPADRLGLTLMHEHIFLDLTRDVAGKMSLLNDPE